MFITGAANGIGRAAARRFSAEGACVAICDMNVEGGEAVATELRDAGGDALFVEADVGAPADMEAAIGRAVETFGGLDVIYNNAGGSTSRDGKVTEMDLDEFWRTVTVDLFGTFLGCRFAIPHLVAAGGGSIINKTSVCALIGTPDCDGYTAAKGGVLALTRALALQWASANIRVNAIAPGVVLTDRVRALLTDDDPIKRKCILGVNEPEDIAALALYLASDESRRMTGAILPIDGGASAI